MGEMGANPHLADVRNSLTNTYRVRPHFLFSVSSVPSAFMAAQGGIDLRCQGTLGRENKGQLITSRDLSGEFNTPLFSPMKPWAAM